MIHLLREKQEDGIKIVIVTWKPDSYGYGDSAYWQELQERMRKAEQNRIEYKEGFNPADIVHTICAYANDIAGVDGGYLVIGVKAENGIPVLPPVSFPHELIELPKQ